MNVYIKKQSFLWQKVAASAIFLVIFIAVLNIFQNQVRNSFYVVSSPFSKVFLQAGQGTAGFFSFFTGFATLQNQRDQAIRQNQDLQNQVALLQDSLKQSQAQQVALANTKSDAFVLVGAEVTGLNQAQDMITINRGNADGISKNMPVISQEKVLYGKVINVYKNFSEIVLISAKNNTIDVKIQNSDITKPDIHGVLKGSGNGGTYLDLINSDVQITQGQAVVTSGLEGTFPKDLPVGTVNGANKNDAQAFQTAGLKPFLDVKNAPALFVITNYKKK